MQSKVQVFGGKSGSIPNDLPRRQEGTGPYIVVDTSQFYLVTVNNNFVSYFNYAKL
jgi:hypothetical protein